MENSRVFEGPTGAGFFTATADRDSKLLQHEKPQRAVRTDRIVVDGPDMDGAPDQSEGVAGV